MLRMRAQEGDESMVKACEAFILIVCTLIFASLFLFSFVSWFRQAFSHRKFVFLVNTSIS